MQKNKNIFVDLDGTLIYEDCFKIQIQSFIKKNYFNFYKLVLLFIFCKRSAVKIKLFSYLGFDINQVTFNMNLINYLKKKKQNGYSLHLYSGSCEPIVKIIFDHLNIFDSYSGSTKNINLTGRSKRDHILEVCALGDFSYIGNSLSDLYIWRVSNNPLVVSNSKIIKMGLHKVFNLNVIDE